MTKKNLKRNSCPVITNQRNSQTDKSKMISGTEGQTEGVLTWVSANELWPGALLGGRGVGSANQLVLGHLSVGLGKLQPKGLGDLWIKPDPLRSKKMCQLKYYFLESICPY